MAMQMISKHIRGIRKINKFQVFSINHCFGGGEGGGGEGVTAGLKRSEGIGYGSQIPAPVSPYGHALKQPY